MKLRIKLTAFFLILFFLKVCAQDKITLYYDQNGKGLDSKKKAAYYRVVALNDSSKAIGIASDFDMSGKLLKTGNASYIDKIDDSKTLWIGHVLSYGEDGQVSTDNNYDAEGKLDSIQMIYTAEGNTEMPEYLHGNPAKEYFLVMDRKGVTTKYSFLTHLPMKPSIYNNIIVPISLRRMMYQDGQVVQFYNIDGMSVAAKISTKQLYGNYYEAYITIENAPNHNLILTPRISQHH